MGIRTYTSLQGEEQQRGVGLSVWKRSQLFRNDKKLDLRIHRIATVAMTTTIYDIVGDGCTATSMADSSSQLLFSLANSCDAQSAFLSIAPLRIP